MGADKIKHFGVCLLLTVLVGCLLTPLAGIIVALLTGMGKELYDRMQGGPFDWLDIAADVGGIAAALLVFALA